MPKEITVEVYLNRRPFWQVLLRLPKSIKEHYKIFRRSNGVMQSLYGAYLMAGISLRVK
jgi:hypothetical protein